MHIHLQPVSVKERTVIIQSRYSLCKMSELLNSINQKSLLITSDDPILCMISQLNYISKIIIIIRAGQSTYICIDMNQGSGDGLAAVLCCSDTFLGDFILTAVTFSSVPN